MPNQESIDRVVAAALPEFEKSLRKALTQRMGVRWAFDLCKDKVGNVFALIYEIRPANFITHFVGVDDLNAPAANPSGEKQNAENTKDSP